MDNEQKVEMMAEKKIWAVIGATPDPKKISNQIYHTFKDYGYEVYGVNPKYEEMDDGSKIYSRLEDLPKTPEAVDFVVPPGVTMDHLQGMDPKIYPNIWLQPDTYNADIVKYAEEKGFTAVHEGACVMAYIRINKRVK